MTEEIQSETQQKITNIKRERKVIKGRLKQERLRFLLRFMLTFLIIFLMFFVSKMKGLYFSPNTFKFVESSSIEIINNNIVPSYKILAILQTIETPKGCVFFVRTNEIKKKLKQLTPIDKIYIRRYAFPARLQIIVRESTPIITVSPDVNFAEVILPKVTGS